MARQSGIKRGAGEAQSITEDWAVTVVPRRAQNAHKWDVGGVVIVAGSPNYAGAAALCCAGAGRSGAGIISAALPRSIAHVVVGLVPEVTVVILPEGESTSLGKRAADAIVERCRRSKAMVVGPGLENDGATDALLSALFGGGRVRGGIGFGAGSGGSSGSEVGAISAADYPIVLDADALNWLANQGSWWERMPKGRLVLTPHWGEMARLLGKDVATVAADPEGEARDAAVFWGQTVVLKGGTTFIATDGGEILSTESHRALATAGSGDVLSGSIGALLAQGLGPSDAAALAVFVGNRAAARVAARIGTLGVVASDLPLAIAEELAVLENLGA